MYPSGCLKLVTQLPPCSFATSFCVCVLVGVAGNPSRTMETRVRHRGPETTIPSKVCDRSISTDKYCTGLLFIPIRGRIKIRRPPKQRPAWKVRDIDQVILPNPLGQGVPKSGPPKKDTGHLPKTCACCKTCSQRPHPVFGNRRPPPPLCVRQDVAEFQRNLREQAVKDAAEVDGERAVETTWWRRRKCSRPVFCPGLVLRIRSTVVNSMFFQVQVQVFSSEFSAMARCYSRTNSRTLLFQFGSCGVRRVQVCVVKGGQGIGTRSPGVTRSLGRAS